MNSNTTLYVPPVLTPDQGGSAIEDVMASNAHSGGLSLHFSGGDLLVKSEDTASIRLGIYTMDGKLAMQRTVEMDAPTVRVPVLPLSDGTYVARITDGEGNTCSVKFVR